jgi:hypothetical protein
MIKSKLVNVLFLLGVASCPGLCRGADQSPEAKSLADRFLQHLADNAPVAGVFEVRHKTEDLAWKKDFEKSFAAQYATNKKKVVFDPADTLRVFDWAWDGTREKCESIAGSDTFETFYRTPEAYLNRVDKNNYNLNKPSRPAYYRPASFYFLAGIMPWHEVFQKTRFAIQAAPEKSPPGTVLLVVRPEDDSPMEWRLLLDRERCTLHEYHQFLRGKILLSAVISKFAHNTDHRLFPSIGRLVVYNPESGKPVFSEELRMQKISFPTSKEQTNASFLMELPRKSEIMDLSLNRVFVLDKPTSVHEIFSGNLPSSPIQQPTIDVGSASHTHQSARWSSLRWLLIVNGIACLLLFIYAVSRAVRARRSSS